MSLSCCVAKNFSLFFFPFSSGFFLLSINIFKFSSERKKFLNTDDSNFFLFFHQKITEKFSAIFIHYTLHQSNNEQCVCVYLLYAPMCVVLVSSSNKKRMVVVAMVTLFFFCYFFQMKLFGLEKQKTHKIRNHNQSFRNF